MSFREGQRQMKEERASVLRQIQAFADWANTASGRQLCEWLRGQIEEKRQRFYLADLENLPTDRIAVMAAQHQASVVTLTQLLDQLEQAPRMAAETAPELAAIEEDLNGQP